METKLFLMVVSGRSGSSYLTKLVDRDNRLVMLGEMLVGKTELQQKQILHDFFQGKLKNESFLGKKAAIGFKTKLNDVIDRQNFLNLIKQHQPIIIINRRRNFLKQAISRARMLVLLENTAKKYGKRHHSPVDKSDIVPAIKVDPDWIYRTAKNFAQRDKELEKFSHKLNDRVATIYYEDFAVEPTVAIAKLSEILEIDINIDNYDVTYKNTSDDLRQAVSNYDELKARLKNTEYSSML